MIDWAKYLNENEDDAKLTGYITYAAYYNCMKRKAYVRYLSEFGEASEFEVKED